MPELTKHNVDQQNEDQALSWQPPSGRLGNIWCVLMHQSPMWPIHGQYECRTCGRHHPVPWAGSEAGRAPAMLVAAQAAQERPAHVPYLRSALLPLVIMLIALVAPSSIRG